MYNILTIRFVVKRGIQQRADSSGLDRWGVWWGVDSFYYYVTLHSAGCRRYSQIKHQSPKFALYGKQTLLVHAHYRILCKYEAMQQTHCTLTTRLNRKLKNKYKLWQRQFGLNLHIVYQLCWTVRQYVIRQITPLGVFCSPFIIDLHFLFII